MNFIDAVLESLDTEMPHEWARLTNNSWPSNPIEIEIDKVTGKLPDTFIKYMAFFY